MLPTENPHYKPWPAVLDYTKQGVEVPGTRRPGQTGHYRNGLFGYCSLETPGGFKTLQDVYNIGLQVSKDKPFLGHRPKVSDKPLKFADHYVWETYAQVDVRRRNIGSALTAMFANGFLAGGELKTVGIWSANRPEWQMIDIALQGYKMVSVSLYDTLGADAVEYIVKHAHTTSVFLTSEHIPSLLKMVKRIPMVKLIVCIDDLPADAKHILVTWGETVGIKVLELRELEALGAAAPLELIPVVPSDVATICYTSGTTSNPKGAILTHGNLAVATESNLWGISMTPDGGILLSYLPLAHIYGRVTELAVIGLGGQIGYFTGDPLRLLEDASVLRPHLFPSVPRVLNRVYQSAMAAGKVPGLKGALFRKAVQVKLDKLHATGDNTHVLWDRLVFSKIQKVLGGSVEMVMSGSAPIAKDVVDFLKIAFACDVGEGYGMTENSATCTRTWPGDRASSGTVGPPQAANEIKLIDVPAMNYTSLDKPHPRGEICMRGDSVFSAYYKDEKNTKETIQSDGWMRTGDIGEFDSAGRLKIIDRVKNIMKLSQGEYVALEKIENTYATTPVVAQLYVHGDSLQPYLLAVLIPDPAVFSRIVSEVEKKKVAPEDIKTLQAACNNETVKAQVMKVLNKEGKKYGLKGFEMIKRVHLSMTPFSIESNTLTPTLKVRRRDAYNLYQAELDALYALGEPTKA